MWRQDSIDISYSVAKKFWHDWKFCLEDQGDTTRLPVVADPGVFSSFSYKFNLFQWQNAERRERYRTFALEQINELISDQTGSHVEACINEMKNKGLKRERSFLTKVCSLARPQTFAPWDRFARAGITSIYERVPASYPEYLQWINEVWDDADGDEIRGYILEKGNPADPSKFANEKDAERAFGLKVLDVLLMKKGGRVF